LRHIDCWLCAAAEHSDTSLQPAKKARHDYLRLASAEVRHKPDTQQKTIEETLVWVVKTG